MVAFTPVQYYSEPVVDASTYVPAVFSPQEIYDFTRLTHKQRVFVEEYTKSLDPNLAAVSAGFQAKGAGKRLLKKPYVITAVENALTRRLSQIQIQPAHVVNGLAAIAFANLQDYVDDSNDPLYVTQIDRLHASAVKKIKKTHTKYGTNTEIELESKLTALTKLGDHLGMFKTQMELTGAGGGPVQIESIEVVGIKQGTYLEGTVDQFGNVQIEQ